MKNLEENNSNKTKPARECVCVCKVGKASRGKKAEAKNHFTVFFARHQRWPSPLLFSFYCYWHIRMGHLCMLLCAHWKTPHPAIISSETGLRRGNKRRVRLCPHRYICTMYMRYSLSLGFVLVCLFSLYPLARSISSFLLPL